MNNALKFLMQRVLADRDVRKKLLLIIAISNGICLITISILYCVVPDTENASQLPGAIAKGSVESH